MARPQLRRCHGNATVGSLLNAVVLRTLAVPSPEQLVALSALEPRANVDGYFYADTFKAYRAIQRSFAQMSMPSRMEASMRS